MARPVPSTKSNGVAAAVESEETPDATTDVVLNRLKDKMRAHFAAQPKVTVKCNKDAWVQINGYSFAIRGGTKVQVPEQVAQHLENGGYI